jgi:hypothetical protein
MLCHICPGYYSRAADTRVSDAHTTFNFSVTSSNQIDKPLHAVNCLGLLVIIMLGYRILSASERHCSDKPAYAHLRGEEEEKTARARSACAHYGTQHEKSEESRVEKQVLLIRCVPPPYFDRFGPYYIT